MKTHPDSQCTGKQVFASYTAADKIGRRRGMKFRDKYKRFKPYRCPHCRQWHLAEDRE